ncbi:MAG: GGDEF domain-containing protein [Desulfobacterales bacterium]|nr:GGDEF domain-containing protein [Desulfobacterales bacterium]
MVKKDKSDAKTVLTQLGSLSEFLTTLDAGAEKSDCFDFPLEIIRQTMLFDVSVLYRVSNLIENRLILEVVKVLDPDGLRLDLKEGRKIRLFLDNRDKRYLNEVAAFLDQKVSHINVPGMGCDIMGYVYLPESFGGAYLFGGDFCGKESSVKDYEVASVEIMCNFVSAILLKTQFKQQAEYDHLTGLFNSGKIKQEAEKIIKRAERKKGSVASIALGDIDFFKTINDTHGHIQGDRVLKQVGDILSSHMRSVFDIAGRYGGEEFLLIFDETDEEQTFKIVERLRQRIETTRFDRVNQSGGIVKGQFLNITISFGVARLGVFENDQTAADWVSRADNALYASKENGRNRTTIFKAEG